MDEVGRDNRKNRVDFFKMNPWNMIPQYQIKEQNAMNMNAKIVMLSDERDAAIKERDKILAEKEAALDERDLAVQQREAALDERDLAFQQREAALDERDLAFQQREAAFDERDLAIQQRDAAIAERDNALRNRDNAIAALQFQESAMKELLENKSNNNACGLKRKNYQSAHNMRDKLLAGALTLPTIPFQFAKSQQVTKTSKNGTTRSTKRSKKMGDDLNKQITTDGSKAEWETVDVGSMNQICFDESTMPGPFCSCTGVARQCYKWTTGGWQSSCCTNSLSEYPLPQLQLPNKRKRKTRIGGRKMSGSVFSRLLTRLYAAGKDLSVPIDLKDYWAKHGTNRYITIK